jgi:hypothetical protein
MQSKMSVDGSLAIKYCVTRPLYSIITNKLAIVGSNNKTNLKRFA